MDIVQIFVRHALEMSASILALSVPVVYFTLLVYMPLALLLSTRKDKKPWPWIGAIRDRWSDCKNVWGRELPMFGIFYTTLSWLGSPVGVPLESLTRRCVSDDPQVAKRRKQISIDCWHLAWLIATCIILFHFMPLCPSDDMRSHSYHPSDVILFRYRFFCASLTLLPMVKLVDVFYTMVMLMVFPARRSRGRVRPLLHLLLHYLQLVSAYACVFLWLQSMDGGTFWMGSSPVGESPRILQPASALYASLVTASTVGFGDVVLAHRHISGWPAACICTEILSAILLTVLFIPYFVSVALGGDQQGVGKARSTKG